VHLSHINQSNREEDAHQDADGQHGEREFDSPAPFKGVARHILLMAEWEVLFDAVNVGWSEKSCLSQRPPACGALALKQVAPACAAIHYLAVRGYLEAFRN